MMVLHISKRVVAICCLAALVVVGGCKSESPVFQINDLVSDPGAYSGALVVEGVVYAYAMDDPTILGVMDKKELQCTTPNCKKVLFPVKVAGDRPELGDEVSISGSIVQEKWGYLLRATKVEVIRNHKLGGAK